MIIRGCVHVTCYVTTCKHCHLTCLWKTLTPHDATWQQLHIRNLTHWKYSWRHVSSSPDTSTRRHTASLTHDTFLTRRSLTCWPHLILTSPHLILSWHNYLSYHWFLTLHSYVTVSHITYSWSSVATSFDIYSWLVIATIPDTVDCLLVNNLQSLSTTVDQRMRFPRIKTNNIEIKIPHPLYLLKEQTNRIEERKNKWEEKDGGWHFKFSAVLGRMPCDKEGMISYNISVSKATQTDNGISTSAIVIWFTQIPTNLFQNNILLVSDKELESESFSEKRNFARSLYKFSIVKRHCDIPTYSCFFWLWENGQLLVCWITYVSMIYKLWLQHTLHNKKRTVNFDAPFYTLEGERKRWRRDESYVPRSKQTPTGSFQSRGSRRWKEWKTLLICRWTWR